MKQFSRRYITIVFFTFIALVSFVAWRRSGEVSLLDQLPIQQLPAQRSLRVPNIPCPSDKDHDGVSDLQDIAQGARAEVNRKPRYHDAYYQGGFPPDSEGVCTDVVWRAMREAGYDLKAMVDQDISKNPTQYPRAGATPDPNIDFRRVSNLIVFLRRQGTELTKTLKPNDLENLSQWQSGDIVTFDYPHEHIAIISDKRRRDGVPYILHNAGPFANESDQLQSWPSKITGHFRYPKF